MNIGELIVLLGKYPKDLPVLLARDEEGNGYHKLHEINLGTIEPSELKENFIDSYYPDEHSDADCCLEPGERDAFVKVITLWP